MVSAILRKAKICYLQKKQSSRIAPAILSTLPLENPHMTVMRTTTSRRRQMAPT